MQKICAIFPNLSLVQSDLQNTLKAVHDTMKAQSKNWTLPDSDVPKWSTNMALRLRVMLRHVQQARIKRNPPAWVRLLELPEWKCGSNDGGGEDLVCQILQN